MAPIPIALESISLLLYICTLSFLISGILRLRKIKVEGRPTISVVVAARNEGEKLPNCLRALLSQTYSSDLSQFIIVNDRSRDRTAAILEEFKQSAPNLQAVHISATPKGFGPKKFALSQGIAAANGELIFTTDADCTPPPEWLAKTAQLFEDDIGIVFGLAPLQYQDNLWGRLLALDTLATASVSAGSAGWNVGVTCTGRNLAYRKKVFEEVNGFSHIGHSLSGDDDLFLQQVKRLTKWKVRYALDGAAAVPSPGVSSLREFVKQRRRHVSASKYYSKRLQAAYLLFNLANVYLFAFLFWSLVQNTFLLLALTFFLSKLLLDFIAIYQIAQKAGDRQLLILFPVWEIFFLINQIVISPLGLLGKIKWR